MKIHAPSRKERNLLLDMTPMIDIVFLLLIFFLTTMQLARESRAEVELPVEMGEKDPAVQPAGLILNVLADGSIVEGERKRRGAILGGASRVPSLRGVIPRATEATRAASLSRHLAAGSKPRS